MAPMRISPGASVGAPVVIGHGTVLPDVVPRRLILVRFSASASDAPDERYHIVSSANRAQYAEFPCNDCAMPADARQVVHRRVAGHACMP